MMASIENLIANAAKFPEAQNESTDTQINSSQNDDDEISDISSISSVHNHKNTDVSVYNIDQDEVIHVDSWCDKKRPKTATERMRASRENLKANAAKLLEARKKAAEYSRTYRKRKKHEKLAHSQNLEQSSDFDVVYDYADPKRKKVKYMAEYMKKYRERKKLSASAQKKREEEKIAAQVESNNKSINSEINNSQNNDEGIRDISSISSAGDQNNTNVPVCNFTSDQDERSGSNKAEKRKKNKKKPKILTLKERVLAIKAYYRKPIYSKIAKRFKCSWEEIKSIIEERKAILEYYEMAIAHATTFSVDELMIRRQKLTFLGACMYEYIQRAQYHENATLDDNILLAQAAEFSYLLRIKSFIATKAWLKQFKISYSIPLTAKKIEMTRTPLASLQPKKIITFCKRVVDLNNKYEPPTIRDEKSEDPKAENTSNSKTKTIPVTPVESKSRQKRRQKINLLEKALYEFIQRAQYHRKTLLNEDLHIKVACELNNLLKIESFTPNKNWIKHFKLHFNINTSQRMIVVNRIPPTSLDLKDILSYCSKLEAVNHENSETEEETIEDQQNSQPKKILNSRVQPETIVTLQFHNVDEVDIKPDINDIEFQILEDVEEVEQTDLKIQAIKSMHLEKSAPEQSANSIGQCSDVEDIKPDITGIEFELVENDEEVVQAALNIKHIKSMHVERNISEQSANSTDQCSDEEDIKPDISDIEFMLVRDDEAVEQQPGLKILQAKSMHVAKNNPEQSITSTGHFTDEEDIKPDISDIEFMVVGNDEVVEHPGLKILQAKSMHVEKNKPEESAISSGHFTGEEDTKADMSDIEFMLVGDDEEVDQPVSKIRKIESTQHVENNTSEQSANSTGHGSHQSSDDEELSKHAQSKKHQSKDNTTTHSIGQSRDKNISRLEDRALVLAAYDSKMTFSKIAEEFNCHRDDIKEIVRNRRSIMSSYKIHNSILMIRQQKITFLGECMFEYTQRAQFHTNVCLDDDILINIATKFSEILQIKNFTVGKSWLDQFKTTYNLPLPLSQLQIVQKRNPPFSLNLRHIISYCRREQTNKLKRGQDLQKLTTKPNSTNLVDTAANVAIRDEPSLLRQHKIDTLEAALYEYIQRSQYHQKMPLNEDRQIKIACELDKILKINNFVPNKGWLNHFKLHYNINTSQRMIVVNRIPPSSLDLKDILSYCCHTYRKKAQKIQETVTGEHVNKEEQYQFLQREEQREEPKQQIFLDLEVQPEAKVTKQANDIRPGVMDIGIALSREQQQPEPLNSTNTAEVDLEYKKNIEFLEECMYEYIQRAQYHVNAYIDDAVLSYKAAKFRDHLHLDYFLVGMSWLRRFKISYNIPVSERQIVLKRAPPTSLNPKEIIAYLRRLRLNKGKICQDSQPIIEEELRLRQHKIDTLEKALFEYLLRLHNFETISLKDDLQIRVACELENILKIEHFVPSKTWLNHFKSHYNTSKSQYTIANPSNRKERSSLDLKDILSYCGHTYEKNNQISSKIITAEHEEEEQNSHLQLEEKESKQPEIQPETEKKVTMEEANDAVEEDVKPLLPIALMAAYDADAEDVKPDVMDIEIELPQKQEQVQPVYSASTEEVEVEEEEEFQSTPLKQQNIVDTLHMDDNSDDEVLPKLTRTYADALKKLKSLEEFSLLEENYRAIGLITQLENIFKNPPSKSN